jgi:GTP-binding protein
VSGRGELHLTILIENMRREGFELAVSRPRVVFKMVDGVRHEPFENLSVDVEEVNQGGVMEELGRRRGDLQNMESDGKGRVRLEYLIPARGLIGFQGEFMTLTRGTGLMSHVFHEYAPVDNTRGEMAGRRNGVLISQDDGAAVAYAIWKLQDRGRMFVSHNDPVYEGMIIGIHSRDNDLVVNPIKGKQLTNVRSSGTDEAVRLVPPIQMSLEYAVEFIEDDELVEITPKSIRLRKRYLKEHERKKAQTSFFNREIGKSHVKKNRYCSRVNSRVWHCYHHDRRYPACHGAVECDRYHLRRRLAGTGCESSHRKSSHRRPPHAGARRIGPLPGDLAADR